MTVSERAGVRVWDRDLSALGAKKETLSGFLDGLWTSDIAKLKTEHTVVLSARGFSPTGSSQSLFVTMYYLCIYSCACMMCVFVCGYIYRNALVEVRDQPAGILLSYHHVDPRAQTQCRTWQQAPLQTEPYRRPLNPDSNGLIPCPNSHTKSLPIILNSTCDSSLL